MMGRLGGDKKRKFNRVANVRLWRAYLVLCRYITYRKYESPGVQ